MRFVERLAVGLLVCLLRTYKLALSSLLPPACRFVPTCSDYVCEALKRHGLLRGAYIGMRRLLRCRPYGQRRERF